MRSLTLSASGRYDDYSDVGSTFNPKVGLTWKPVDGVSIRGNYGESFNAPSMPDKVPRCSCRIWAEARSSARASR